MFVTLLVVGLISYGQILMMNFWQDDNAVVFKFTHINEDAGYLGKGILGEGPYRYTVASYYPVFKIFGYRTLPYYAFMLFWFITSVYAVYFLFLELFENQKKAFLSGLLYAAGYVASDGFIRMFNSVLASISVIFVCLTIVSYSKYYKHKRIKWFVASLIFFILAIEIGYIRNHYLVFLIGVFEIILFLFRKVGKKNIRGVIFCILRMVPFIFLFWRWYIVSADTRSAQVIVLIKDLVHGEFYKLYSLFASFGNMLLSVEISPKIYDVIEKFFGFPLSERKIILSLMVLTFSTALYLTKLKFISRKAGIIYVIFNIAIFFLIEEIFSNPVIVAGVREKGSLYFCAFFISLGLLLSKSLPNIKINIILFLWLIFNLGAYAAYLPTYSYSSDNRYLLHSLIPLVGLFSNWSYDFYDRNKKRVVAIIPLILVFMWGGTNLYSSVVWERKIVVHRSNPSKRFYKELKEYVPSFQEGSVFYFYIPTDEAFAHIHYDACFGVAQMPEETAIAWRYGKDRYDLVIVNSYGDLAKYISENRVPPEKVFAFIAGENKLIDVSSETRRIMFEGFRSGERVNINSKVKIESSQLLVMEPVVIYPQDVPLLTEVELQLLARAWPIESAFLDFPLKYLNGEMSGYIADDELRNRYIEYFHWLDDYYEKTEVDSTSQWKNFSISNILDRDNSTYWEADRILWDKHTEGFQIKLEKEREIGAVFYKNGPQSLLPTSAEIYASTDGKIFNLVGSFDLSTYEWSEWKKVVFERVSARYLKVVFRSTLSDDAPGVAEFIVVPFEYSDLDPGTAVSFSRSPFSRVDSDEDWFLLLSNFSSRALIRLLWKSDFSDSFHTESAQTVSFPYDGRYYKIAVKIPAGGRYLEAVKIDPITIPGTLEIANVAYEVLKIF